VLRITALVSADATVPWIDAQVVWRVQETP
jgi:hypothetical protein